MQLNNGDPVILKKDKTFNGFHIPRGTLGTVCQMAPNGALVVFQMKGIFPLLGLSYDEIGKIYKG